MVSPSKSLASLAFRFPEYESSVALRVDSVVAAVLGAVPLEWSTVVGNESSESAFETYDEPETDE